MAMASCPAGDPNASPKHSNGHASPLDLLRRFHKLQVERVEGYGQFEEFVAKALDPKAEKRKLPPREAEAFNVFMDGSSGQEAQEHNFNAYKQRVAEITMAFRRISEEIIHIKNSLRDTHNKAEISAIIEKIQDLEETKLKLTADLQIARKNAADEPDNDDMNQVVANLRQRLDGLAQEITETLEDLKYESEDLYAQEIDDETLR